MIYDIFIIGGGINGCGVARDASGRGLKICLAEMDDLASGTSSASTKLIHGGLRYLKYFDFKLVKEALKERDVLLKIMPHICWPMRFLIPLESFRINNFFIRCGLFIYDYIAGYSTLTKTKSINLQNSILNSFVKSKFKKAFIYSDCWVEDSRLVVLNAVDAKKMGANILTRTKVINFTKKGSLWSVTTKNKKGEIHEHLCKCIVNASGPWVENINQYISLKSAYSTRLVKGSHLVVDKLFDHNHAFFLTGKDGRIIFVIPFQDEFSLIGTTEVVHQNIEIKPNCSDEETKYLLNFINSYFSFNLKKDQIISTFSGVRPLYNKKKQHNENISSITRDYVLNLEYLDHLPFLTIYGGKLTTFRKLSENVLSKLKDFFPEMGHDWTMKKPLPGGDFLLNEKKEVINKLQKNYPYLGQNCAKRFINYYGTLSYQILKNVKSKKDLGINFGHSLTEIEVDWLLKNEFANSADDILWRRTKLGLKFNKSQKNKLIKWIETRI